MASPVAAERKLPGWLMAAAASEPEGERGKAGPNTPVKGKGKGRKRSQNGAKGK